MNVHFSRSNSLSGSDRHAYTGNKTLLQRIWLTVSSGDVYNLKITFPVFDCTRRRQQNTKTVVVLQFILLSPVKLAGIIQTALHWSFRYFKPEGRIQRTRKPMSTLQWWEVLSLHTSQVAHKAGAYLGFCSMKRLWVFLLPLDRMLLPIYTPGWREALTSESKVFHPRTQHMSPARARTRTARSAVERTNHEFMKPPIFLYRASTLKMISA